MAFTHEWTKEGAFINYFKKLTAEDLIKSESKLIGNAEFEKIKFVIVDFTNVTEREVDDTSVIVSTLFAINANPYNKYIKVALISKNKELQLLIGKYIDNTLKQLPHAQQKLFENITNAQAWAAS